MEQADEFEFDLSDVDVAAFESVATEDTTTEEQQSPETIKIVPTTQQPPRPPQHVTSATGKILLVPINSKLFQLPGSTPITLFPFPMKAASLPAQDNKQPQPQLQLQLQSQSQIQSQSQSQPQTQAQTQQHLNQQTSIKNEPALSLNTRTATTPNEIPKRKPCNCTKSQCLKLYCDCFANGEFCSGCNCTNCFNSLAKEKERQKAISQCLERNPEAFRPKIGKAVKLSDTIERRHTKGCNCKRSGCLKNYCECYEAKILCSNLCKCCGCKNYEESFERKSLMQLANSATENARGILKNLLPTNNNSSTGKDFTKSFITNKVIHASLMCLLQTAQQAEKDETSANNIPNLIQVEMGKCLRMIVDSATESASSKKR